MSKRRTTHRVLQGIPVSPGIVTGAVFVHDPRHPPVERRRVKPEEVEAEVARLDEAVEQARRQLRETRKMVSSKIDDAHASIFEAQEVLLDDPLLTDSCRELIRSERWNAEYALEATLESVRTRFQEIQAPHFSFQNLDILDVATRIRENLMPETEKASAIERAARNKVIVAHDLHPSDTARLSHRHILGIVTEAGGPTSHSAILAKALQIPAVIGVEGLMSHLQSYDTVIVDGSRGVVNVEPTKADLERMELRMKALKAAGESLHKIKDLPCETRDGYAVELSANLELPAEVDAILESGAQGIGLFRSEFFYIDRGCIPSEEEQFLVYKDVVERMAPQPVICRTLDLGGDKFISQPGMSASDLNPFLGLRAIRLCLANPDIFAAQLRAILRASAFGRVKIMLPFITDISEVRRSREFLQRVCNELKQKGQAFDEDIDVGIMVETPSAALTAEALAREVDFFSIGTNDLIQYTMAVDRANESVAELYNPLHPAVIHLIARTIDAAHKAGIWVGVCGEMAGDPALAALLVGMGIDELSMSSVAVPEVKRLIRSMDLEEVHEFRGEVMAALAGGDAQSVMKRFRRKIAKRFPEA